MLENFWDKLMGGFFETDYFLILFKWSFDIPETDLNPYVVDFLNFERGCDDATTVDEFELAERLVCLIYNFLGFLGCHEGGAAGLSFLLF